MEPLKSQGAADPQPDGPAGRSPGRPGEALSHPANPSRAQACKSWNSTAVSQAACIPRASRAALMGWAPRAPMRTPVAPRNPAQASGVRWFMGQIVSISGGEPRPKNGGLTPLFGIHGSNPLFP